MGFDIIGDIHGHADKLEALLARLDYRQTGGAWRHPDRTAIFVGDLIDRGPGQLRTLQIVRAMCDAGSAEAVMGNHEFNAIGWATTDPGSEWRHLRPRHGDRGEKNRRQHEAFLSEVGPDSPEHHRWIDWFLELPLWIERPGFRVIHACWDPVSAAVLKPHLRDGVRIDLDLVAAAHQRDAPAYKAIETLLKGAEVELPEGYAFIDKDGHHRSAMRTRWWSPELITYRAAYLGPDGVNLPDIPMPAQIRIAEPDRPTFIGHYWLNPASALKPLSSRVVCVDYSVAKGGLLVAYRFEGGSQLFSRNFVAV